MGIIRSRFGALVVGACMLPSIALALPFNKDMVDVQLRAGSATRPSVPGTVALGSLSYRVESKADAEQMANAVERDAASVGRGKRLFEVNCSACHGWYTPAGKVQPPVAKGVSGENGYMGLPAPDITAEMYKQRTDGFFYGTIHFGGMAIMPAYGWKLSPHEHWDIVNYVRHIQGFNYTK